MQILAALAYPRGHPTFKATDLLWRLPEPGSWACSLIPPLFQAWPAPPPHQAAGDNQKQLRAGRLGHRSRVMPRGAEEPARRGPQGPPCTSGAIGRARLSSPAPSSSFVLTAVSIPPVTPRVIPDR